MIFTVQVVDWQHSVLDKSLNISNNVWKNTVRMLDLLNKHDITATFFVENRVATKYPVLVRKIQAAHHEVACYIDDDYRKEGFQQTCKHAVDNLEDITGKKIFGIQCKSIDPLQVNFDHYCSCLKSVGIRYDTSITTHLSITRLEASNPSIGAFQAYDIALFPRPALARLPLLNRVLSSFGGSSFRWLPYEITALLAGKLDRESAIFSFPVYDLDNNEYATLQSSFQLPWHRKLDFYARQSTPEKLHKLFGDFPFDSFMNLYSVHDKKLV